MWKGSGWVVSGGLSAPECGVVYMGGGRSGKRNSGEECVSPLSNINGRRSWACPCRGKVNKREEHKIAYTSTLCAWLPRARSITMAPRVFV